MNKEIQIIEEQEICISCGICCDGTLYGKANLYPGEKGNLPEKIEERYFTIDKAEYFKLPCSYFSGKCTIYNLKKALVCSGFKCKLLVNFTKEKIPKVDALKIIANVKKYRREVEDLAFAKYNIPKGTPFKILQGKVFDIKHSENTGFIKDEIENLIGKCLILEVLLTKYFLSQEDYNKMIINPTSEELFEIKNNLLQLND
jgi:hypothetical protein